MTQNSEAGETNYSASMGDSFDFDQVQILTWALLDDALSSEEFSLLNSLLLRSEEARDSYLGTLQLHTILMDRFSDPPPNFVVPDVAQCAGPCPA